MHAYHNPVKSAGNSTISHYIGSELIQGTYRACRANNTQKFKIHYLQSEAKKAHKYWILHEKTTQILRLHIPLTFPHVIIPPTFYPRFLPGPAGN